MKSILATQTSMYQADEKFEVILHGELADKKWIQRNIFCDKCNEQIATVTTKSDLEDHYLCFKCDRKQEENYDTAELFNREEIQVRKHSNP